MSQIGPAMPPHLAKRKREADADNDAEDGRRVRRGSPIGPAPAPAKAATAQGPTLPPQHGLNEDEIDLDYGDSDDDTAGQAPPPAKASTAPGPAPHVPPNHAANADEIDLDYGDSDDDNAGPAPPSAASQPARPVMGPTMGPTMPSPRDAGPRDNAGADDARSDGKDGKDGKDSNSNSNSNSDSDSDSDDSDFGPALPGADDKYPRGPVADNSTAKHSGKDDDDDDDDTAPFDPYSAAPSQRDDWMLTPPSDNKAANLAADPTKIRPRGFATGRAAASGAGGGAASSAIGSLWTETLQQKSQRLADTVLGRAADPRRGGGGSNTAAPAAGPVSGSSAAMAAANAEREAQIRAYTEATRGKSLYEAHQESLKSGKTKKDKDRDDRDRDDSDRSHRRADKSHNDKRRHDRHSLDDRDGRDEDRPFKKSSHKSAAQEEDDDPSARAFDRDKDMRIGVQINNKQRRDLVSRAGDFGGRFSKGSFL
ncbi:hypothetical protein SCUCBS95973_002505 [Sporothrix curviconia]|uniref:DUF3752 domain-containing protein n=1 Tax=Sporothrix curviconia TaxID=1260050 RepID=A0ABP0B7L4_9PEZI